MPFLKKPACIGLMYGHDGALYGARYCPETGALRCQKKTSTDAHSLHRAMDHVLRKLGATSRDHCHMVLGRDHYHHATVPIDPDLGLPEGPTLNGAVADQVPQRLHPFVAVPLQTSHGLSAAIVCAPSDLLQQLYDAARSWGLQPTLWPEAIGCCQLVAWMLAPTDPPEPSARLTVLSDTKQLCLLPQVGSDFLRWQHVAADHPSLSAPLQQCLQSLQPHEPVGLHCITHYAAPKIQQQLTQQAGQPFSHNALVDRLPELALHKNQPPPLSLLGVVLNPSSSVAGNFSSALLRRRGLLTFKKLWLGVGIAAALGASIITVASIFKWHQRAQLQEQLAVLTTQTTQTQAALDEKKASQQDSTALGALSLHYRQSFYPVLVDLGRQPAHHLWLTRMTVKNTEKKPLLIHLTGVALDHKALNAWLSLLRMLPYLHKVEFDTLELSHSSEKKTTAARSRTQRGAKKPAPKTPPPTPLLYFQLSNSEGVPLDAT